ncbi:hypothetical protein PR048_021558 [Dryococelus australis]|uniref:Interleukin-6 n=1 Tax=Dryococelus australis TaxID=614101 RepID=A0ABQ9GYK6_9NEOP|nr:hypothetical protein PR048_021558 [Dryococelus australis]
MATSGNVKLPPDVDFQSPTVYMDWKFSETQLEDYLVSMGQDQSHDKVNILLLRNMMGSESVCILTAIEKYTNSRMNEVFERYIFNQRVQEYGECFDHFLTSLQQLVCKLWPPQPFCKVAKAKSNGDDQTYPNEWHENFVVESRRLQMKLDTGVQVSVLTLKIFEKMNSQFKVDSTNTKLKK